MLREAENESYDAQMHSSSTGMSDRERQLELRKASEKYLHGEISAKQLEQAEKDLGVDYAKTFFGLNSATREVLGAMRKTVEYVRSKLLK